MGRFGLSKTSRVINHLLHKQAQHPDHFSLEDFVRLYLQATKHRHHKTAYALQLAEELYISVWHMSASAGLACTELLAKIHTHAAEGGRERHEQVETAGADKMAISIWGRWHQVCITRPTATELKELLLFR